MLWAYVYSTLIYLYIFLLLLLLIVQVFGLFLLATEDFSESELMVCSPFVHFAGRAANQETLYSLWTGNITYICYSFPFLSSRSVTPTWLIFLSIDIQFITWSAQTGLYELDYQNRENTNLGIPQIYFVLRTMIDGNKQVGVQVGRRRKTRIRWILSCRASCRKEIRNLDSVQTKCIPVSEDQTLTELKYVGTTSLKGKLFFHCRRFTEQRKNISCSLAFVRIVYTRTQH